MVDAQSAINPDLLKVSILGSESIHVGCTFGSLRWLFLYVELTVPKHSPPRPLLHQ